MENTTKSTPYMKSYSLFILLFLFSLAAFGQTMVLFVPQETVTGPPPVSFTATFTGNVIYKGVSVIDAQGIGYYNEFIPFESKIAVEIIASLDSPGNVLLMTSHPDGLAYFYNGAPLRQGRHYYDLSPNDYTPNSVDEVGILEMTLTDDQVNGSVVLRPRIDVKSLPATQTEVIPVNIGGRVWMDRNLGAHRRPTDFFNDPFSKGSLYQWGRNSDGHEIIVTDGNNPSRRKYFAQYRFDQSDTPGAQIVIGPTDTSTLSSPLFNTPNGDWRATQNGNLWRSTEVGGGVNNPCPSGYRLPTYTEALDLITNTIPNGFASSLSSLFDFSYDGFAGGGRILNTITQKIDNFFYIQGPNPSQEASFQSTFEGTPGIGTVNGRPVFGINPTSSSHGFTPKANPLPVRCIQN